MRNILLYFAGLGLLFVIGCAGAAGKESGAGGDPLSGVVAFYRGPLNHLSAVRHGECPMYPSCSDYSLQAIRKHGMWIGWIMAHDRLMRCGRDETRTARKILVNGKWKYYDPVEGNDRWWSEKANYALEE
ncbi:MAG: membrane protein insertion efficiency factor YidD [Desulfobacterales bacterium]|nr:membrane protein insertion efficiency factor YidD [Desulfobacterales bacterium]